MIFDEQIYCEEENCQLAWLLLYRYLNLITALAELVVYRNGTNDTECETKYAPGRYVFTDYRLL
jgi:hypothetical protein